ncbi:GcrA family cell cycle regulator [Bradyrhizobium neotropicale]|uniref:GcrA family cell cycle regulator n=1 Tax=Bradyrhizobium neotropicale TaxID=1497615 RepID=UPI001AD6B6C6|nr:GcrA family cell cycle regulator [Bradyrhizobium neotropicale]MBO4228160.1 hypothetical protein [Bradyrhizobium neotropicale]
MLSPTNDVARALHGPWINDSLVARLIALNAQHYSFGEIARLLSLEFNLKLSRNSIIAKARRLGLEHHEPLFRSAYTRAAKAPKESVPKRKVTVRAPLPPMEPPRCVALLDLADDECRYPLGKYPFKFCGRRPKLRGSSYCAEHYAIVWRQP